MQNTTNSSCSKSNLLPQALLPSPWLIGCRRLGPVSASSSSSPWFLFGDLVWVHLGPQLSHWNTCPKPEATASVGVGGRQVSRRQAEVRSLH